MKEQNNEVLRVQTIHHQQDRIQLHEDRIHAQEGTNTPISTTVLMPLYLPQEGSNTLYLPRY